MSGLWFSNRYEVLAERLVEALGGARPSIFEADQVIVPSAALQRDLSLRITERHGVCAQVEFSFLAQWLWRQVGRALPRVGADSPFAQPVLAWRLDRLLADPTLAAGHPRLGAYLGAADAVMRFGFASRLAGLFDHYITYRSDWLAAWAEQRSIAPPAGHDARAWQADQAWQAALWRRLLAQLALDGGHPLQQFLQQVEAAAAATAPALPGRVHVFCLPAIPPLYLQALQRLGRLTDLQLYVSNPCREYWFDLVDRRRLSHLAARGLAQHAEVGNPLLAGWGQQTQAQIDLLLDTGDDALPDEAEFVEAPGGELLARLQNAILNGVSLAPGSVVLAPDDRSLEVHVCHSMTRELEVLHDHLLGLFARAGQAGEPPLLPQHILVVTPDLEAAAPLIDAVFGTAPPERHIPFAVTGRPRRTVNRCAQALRDVLALLASHCPASAVFELLQQPAVSRRFGLDDSALAQVHDWIGEAGVHWGLGGDAADSADAGAERPLRHGLADGLQRLFLAHVLPRTADQPLDGQLPAGIVEGSEALVLGAFWQFAQELRSWQAALARPHTARGWLVLLLDLLDGLLLPLGDEVDELRELQASLRRLAAQMAEGGLTEASGALVEPAVLRAALELMLEEAPRGGVPTGRVTFAALSSLRSLPFRVVCVIGLNDGAFPSVARPLEFDLMAQQPRRGDRQRRSEERNTLLDLLLAARDSLYLGFTGRSVRDNAPLPPSVLLSELLDLLLPAIAQPPDDRDALATARTRLVVEHPLQAFSPLAFALDGDPRLRSYRRDHADALRASRHAAAGPEVGLTAPFEEDPEDDDDPELDHGSPQAALVFFDRPLAPPGPEWRSPDIETLVRFFRNPCRALLEQRLRLHLPYAEEDLADDEPFLPDYHGRQVLVTRVLPAALAGASADRLQALATASVGQPDGRIGAVAHAQELTRLRAYAERLSGALAAPTLPPRHQLLQRRLHGEDWQLEVGFADLRTGGLLHHRYDVTRVTDRLRAWIWHLALCACAPAGVSPVSTWHARDGVFRLRPCADAPARLDELLSWYRQGLSEPLHFFPRSSWAYVERGGGPAGLVGARSKWLVSPYHFGEAADAAYRLALRGRPDPLDAAFEACSLQLLGPLCAHLESDMATEDAAT